MGKHFLSLFFVAGVSSAAVGFLQDGETFVSRGAHGEWRVSRNAIRVSTGDGFTTALRFDGSTGSAVIGEEAGAGGFAKVRVRSVYPGIDAVVYGKGRDIEYDFVVGPGADPSRIRMSWESRGSVRWTVRQSEPVAYQNAGLGRMFVAAAQRVDGPDVSFHLGAYDRSRALVIDPVLSLVDLGEASLERATAAAVDAEGNIFAAGVTRAASGSSAFFVTKMTRTRKLVYKKTLNGAGSAGGALLAVDALGNAWVAGSDSGTTVFKLNPSGETIDSTPIAGEGLVAKAIGVDGSGSAYLLFDAASRARVMRLGANGAIESDWTGPLGPGGMWVDLRGTVTIAGKAAPDFAATSGAVDDPEGAIAIVRMMNGQVTAAARAGSVADIPVAVAADASGSVFVIGESGGDGFVTRLDSLLMKVIYRARIAGDKADHPLAIAVDGFGVATVTGVTESKDLQALNALEGSSAAENGASGFLTRLSAEGVRLVESYLPAGEVAMAAAGDGAGGVWLAGSNAKGASLARFEPGADGAIELSHAGAIRAGRAAGRFSVRSMNTGSEMLADRAINVTEAVEGIEIEAMSGLGWTCAEGTCRRADVLAPGQEDPVITVLAKVAGNVSGVQSMTATLAAAGDGISQNSASVDRFSVSYGPDLTIQKVHFGNFSQGQNGATFLIRVTNAGTLSTNGTVTVTDTLPQGLTLVSMTGTGWTCNSNTCSRQDALAPDQTWPQITVTVNVALNAPGSVANTAAVAGGGDADTTNNTVIDPTVIRGPDLRITKVHSQNFLPGQQGAQYTITVSNGGASATNGLVTVTDTLPTGLTLVSMSGSGWSCSQVTCSRSDALAPNASYPVINLSVNAAADAPTLVTNTASVSGGGDTDASNNTASDPTSVQAGVDLRISKTHVSGNRRNALISYDVVVTNIGTLATSGTVTVSDTLPSSLTLNSISGQGWACVQASCSRSDVLAAGAAYPPIRVVALSSATAGASVTNIAAVFADNDIASANNVATVTTPLVYSDLTISKSHFGSFVRTTKGRYSIVVSNNGTAATTDPTVVTDTLPNGLTLSSAGGPGWSCAVNVCTNTDPVGAGSSLAPLTVIVDVANNAPDSVTNTASVAGTDDTAGNNIATDPTTITAPTDLRITKVHNGGDFVRGQQGATYTISVANIGAAFSTGTVFVNDILPASVTLVSMQGPGWTCAGTTCSRNDTLAQSQTYQPITVTVNVASDAPSQLTNTAILSGGGDNNTANNTASDTAPVGTADLTITKTHNGNFFRGQQGATYEITVTNVGVAPTLGTVTVTDTLPAGMTLFSAIGAGWNCAQTSCTRSDVLAPNTAYPVLRIRVNVANDAAQQLVNAATVFGGNDPKTGNNTAADPTTIDAAGSGGPAAPDILSPSAGQVVPALGVTFQWTAVNNATGYDLRIVESQTSKLIFTGVMAGSASNQTLVTLPNGSYVFRVRSCVGGFTDATCGAFASQSFTVAATAPTTAPSPTTPTANQLITGSTINFSWTSVSGASNYEMWIVPAGGGAPEIQAKAPGTSAIYSLRSGVYDMLLRACTQLCGPWSAARRFTVQLGPVPTQLPEISLATFGDNSITVSWLPVPSADLFRVLVVQPGGGPGGGALTAAARRVSSSPANFQIPAGVARVLVAGCNGDGCGPFATSDQISPAAAQPTAPILAAPEPGSTLNGPVVLFTWNRVPGDNGTNTWYRLFVQDQSRQSAALDIRTRNNFYAANFKAEGTRYDALVISNPGTGIEIQGPPIAFLVRGNSPAAPTAVAPQHLGTVQGGNVQLSWTPVPGATLYEYYVSGPANPVVRGVTPGLLVQAPLTAVNGQPTNYQMIVRACPSGATCAAGSDAGWGPWSQDVTGTITFTVAP